MTINLLIKHISIIIILVSNSIIANDTLLSGPGSKANEIDDLTAANQPERLYCENDVDSSSLLSCRTRFAYIANQASGAKDPDTISICSVKSDGSLKACVPATYPLFNQPIDIVTNKAATVAFVLNTNPPTISQCALQTNGLLGSCSTVYTAANDCDFDFGGLDPTDRYLYITENGYNSVLVCEINTDGTFVGNCVDSGILFNGPNGRIAISPDGKTAYIANNISSEVSICSINALGTFDICSTSDGNGTIIAPLGVALSWTGKTLYIANQNNTVSICSVNSDSSLGTCTASLGNGTFDFSDNTEINLFISNRRVAYIPNPAANRMSICPINADGTFATCMSNNDPTFDSPSSAWLTLSY